jgi:hypothetical protein
MENLQCRLLVVDGLSVNREETGVSSSLGKQDELGSNQLC